jgi:hypothetical protein
MISRGSDAARTDYLVISLLVLAGFAIDLYVGRFSGLKGTACTLLLFVPSIIYLGMRRAKPWRKIALASLVLGLLLGFFYEFVMQAAGGYDVTSVYLPRLFQTVPIDSIAAHMVMTCTILVYFEHFVRQKSSRAINASRFKKLLYLVIVLDVLVVTLHYMAPQLLHLPYPYAVMGLLAVIPVLLKVYRQPSFSVELLKLVPFFFTTFMLFMIVAIRFHWWSYPSTTHYVGWVTLFSSVSFPFEELSFWMLLYAPAIVTYYRVLIDQPERA